MSQHIVSGKGVIVAVSVNHHPWLPGLTPPYAVIIVELDDAPGVRLTSALVDEDLDSARIGVAVEVTFEQREEIWLPLFRVSGEDERAVSYATPMIVTRPPASSDRFEERSVLSGVGVSEVGRRLTRGPVQLAVEASLAAVADAGLELSDIDGLSTYPGALGGGMSEGGISTLEEALGLHPTWINGGMELPGQGGAIVAAMLAVASGLCRHVLCVRTVWEARYSHLMRNGEISPPPYGRFGDDLQWRLPYGAASATTWIGMAASAYFHNYGADREVLGRIAINSRQGAARNPLAIYQDPMTMEEYLGARMISTPFGLYDCDVPCDGSVAVIVSSADVAGDVPNGAVRVAAVGTQVSERISWDQGVLTHEPLVLGPAQHLWSRTDLTCSDVDVALLYDGFTFNCLSWLEALGFCGLGEASAFIGDGHAISLAGPLPVNPHGGQLSAGRLHGFGFMHEAMLQLRGRAGERQVSGAEVAVVTTGGGAPGGCLLLTGPGAG